MKPQGRKETSLFDMISESETSKSLEELGATTGFWLMAEDTARAHAGKNIFSDSFMEKIRIFRKKRAEDIKSQFV